MARKKRKLLPVKKTTYTGLLGPQAQSQTQRGAYRAPTGFQSITQGGLGEVKDEGLMGDFLTPMLATKEGVEQIQEMYKGGQNLREGFTSIPDYAEKTWDYLGDRGTDIGNWFSGSPSNVTQLQGSTNYSPAVNFAKQSPSAGITTGGAPKWNFYENVNPNFGSQNVLQSGVLSQGGAGTVPSPYYPMAGPPELGGTLSQGGMGATASAGMGTTVPLDYGIQGGSTWAEAIANTGGQGSTLMGDVVGQGSKFAGDAYTGMQAGEQALASAGAAEASMLSKVGSIAGLGLNAYDIANQGVTANNMMGLMGSGIMASTAMLGLSQAWNPVGWALLGASALGSLTDWW